MLRIVDTRILMIKSKLYKKKLIKTQIIREFLNPNIQVWSTVNLKYLLVCTFIFIIIIIIIIVNK
jgi:hypothetical protein